MVSFEKKKKKGNLCLNKREGGYKYIIESWNNSWLVHLILILAMLM
jgi:hypothetical protein